MHVFCFCVRRCVARSKSKSGGDGVELLLQLIGSDEKSGRGRSLLEKSDIVTHVRVRACVGGRKKHKKQRGDRRVVCIHLLLSMLSW